MRIRVCHLLLHGSGSGVPPLGIVDFIRFPVACAVTKGYGCLEVGVLC